MMEQGHIREMEWKMVTSSIVQRHTGFCTRYSSWPVVGGSVVTAWNKNGILPSLIFKSGANAGRGVLQGSLIGL